MNKIKCPLCLTGNVVINDKITEPSLVKYVGEDSNYASCSVCTANGVVIKGGVCINWSVRTKNSKPVTHKEMLAEKEESLQKCPTASVITNKYEFVDVSFVKDPPNKRAFIKLPIFYRLYLWVKRILK